MTQIASYYASVGVGIDQNSLRNVQNYLDTIQKKMESFQKKAFKTPDLPIRLNNFSVNQAALRRSINAALSHQNFRLNSVSVGKISVSSARLRGAMREALMSSSSGQGGIRLNEFSVNQKALVAALNSALNKEGVRSRVRIGALLSQSSLTDMRNQIRQAINQLVVNPTINPRISQAVARQARLNNSGGRSSDRITTRDPRSQNPWHNPMMIGGGAGAFLRYGAFSLPFIAGAYGLNALNTFAFEAASQRTSLDMVSSMSTTGRSGEDNREYLRGLAQTIGKTSMGMAPIYTQMLAASTGTELEPQMQDMFTGIMQYASVMGLGEQSIKRAMTGF